MRSSKIELKRYSFFITISIDNNKMTVNKEYSPTYCGPFANSCEGDGIVLRSPYGLTGIYPKCFILNKGAISHPVEFAKRGIESQEGRWKTEERLKS